MSNLTDALIAAKLVGGSGGSGGGSGLPEITTETIEVVAEQTVAFSSVGGGIYAGGIEGDFSINVGDALIVNWDGTPYTCVVTEFYGSPTWGNFSIEGAGADTGEPFLMANRPGNGIEIETLSGETHVCQISSMAQVPPDGYILGVDDGEWKAVPSGGGSASSSLEVVISASREGYSCNKTYAEILEAFDANTPIDATVFAGTNVLSKVHFYAYSASRIRFFYLSYHGTGLRVDQLVLNSSNEITAEFMIASGTWTNM